MITANGRRGDWVTGNAATLYLDLQTLKPNTSLEFRVWPHISRQPVRSRENCCHWLLLLRKMATLISRDSGGLVTSVANNCCSLLLSSTFSPSLKLECDKLASEKSEMQRHYIMVSKPVAWVLFNILVLPIVEDWSFTTALSPPWFVFAFPMLTCL